MCIVGRDFLVRNFIQRPAVGRNPDVAIARPQGRATLTCNELAPATGTLRKRATGSCLCGSYLQRRKASVGSRATRGGMHAYRYHRRRVGRRDSGASLVVFKTLNTTGAGNMAGAADYPIKPLMLVAGDDAGSKPVVMELVGKLGFETVQAGPLKNARLLVAWAMVWIDQAMKRGRGRDFAFALVNMR